MGGGNGQKSAMKRAKNLEKAAGAAKGSQLKTNAAAMSIKCAICLQTFMCTTAEHMLRDHATSRHPKSTITACFSHLT
eukprot:CAMPEP_0175080748 /NCGR_PEP_ID=MMETSP0052_2-20121109/25715_1 /TAXON_ID=51329 ORGANISM="Polytomella parva, Strain SAG 63-3" /NCGR_SAMPLE_ID=MMETSP0052_2 /ASSEMBLY_ACC=CAM_ASM_000194 /LENGTH=77 /DNA_ID=CAMNT_0016351553 /DNA_START=101 /DNA_END=334 /DNA_ORIENTATION=-